MHYSKWIQNVLNAQNTSDLAHQLALFESCLKSVCFQRAWFNSLGHWTFDRLTLAQREEDKRLRQLDRSVSTSVGLSFTNNNNSLSSNSNSWFVSSHNVNANLSLTSSTNLVRTKTPRPIRHTVWKTRGEEYRSLGGDGWIDRKSVV